MTVRAWLLFAAGTVLVLAAMGWITVVTLRLDRAERIARAEAAYQESVRLSLWRMDSWLAPQLAPESGRPFFEYLPYYAQERAYTRLLNSIETGEVLTPSPLLTFESEYFPVHFQISGEGTLSSPQVPEGNLLDLAEATLLDSDRTERKRERLREVEAIAGRVPLGPRVQKAELCVIVPESVPVPPLQDYQRAPEQQDALSKAEWAKRTASQSQILAGGNEALNRLRQQVLVEDATPMQVGPLVPLWLDLESDEPCLLYLRRVQVDANELLQGFLVDWPMLRAALLEQLSDLFPDATLDPVALETLTADPAPTALATLPAALRAPRDGQLASAAGITPLRLGLGVTWIVVLATIVAAAVSLRATIAYGERRNRFASAVTHELRTPLTTFRMYSEMLADDMVPSEASRREYVETLRRESQRLSTLVENVMAYARLERGRGATDRQRVAVVDLLERVGPRLQERAADAGLDLSRHGDLPVDAVVNVDVEAVGQILFNLVDNACKYAGAPPLELSARVDDGRVLVAVRDHGPGVPAREAAHIFRPFERGRGNGSRGQGIGLGLALSRGLARDLGGDLRLTECPDGGARFELSLPLA